MGGRSPISSETASPPSSSQPGRSSWIAARRNRCWTKPYNRQRRILIRFRLDYVKWLLTRLKQRKGSGRKLSTQRQCADRNKNRRGPHPDRRGSAARAGSLKRKKSCKRTYLF